MEARLTRRLVALELADVSVPPPPAVRPDVAALHFRVVSERGDSVRVELWQLGQAHGARSVSTRGSTQLRARRIALAAAELARQLRHRRNAEAVQGAKEAARTAEERRRARGVPIYGRLSPFAALQGAAVGPGELLLGGPTLGVALRFSNGVALELRGSYLAGAATGAADEPARWMELSLAPSLRFWDRAATNLGAGLVAGVAAAHLDGARATEDERSQDTTWSARAAVEVFLEQRLSPALAVRVGPDAGVVLRRLLVTRTSGEKERLGGLWLGLTAGVVLDPWGAGAGD